MRDLETLVAVNISSVFFSLHNILNIFLKKPYVQWLQLFIILLLYKITDFILLFSKHIVMLAIDFSFSCLPLYFSFS